MGKALLGHRGGDRVAVEVSPDRSYFLQIRKVTKAEGDDETLEIRGY